MNRPINTYQGRGCAKNVSKWQHCIAFTGKAEPDLLTGELPKLDGKGMLPAVRISPARRSDRIAPTSRINFGQLYTVEHNVKVYNFDDVHRDYI
jgi:hypothetical protein